MANRTKNTNGTPVAAVPNGHTNQAPAVQLSLDLQALQPLISKVVAETIAQLQADQTDLGDRLAFSEAEAARLLGLNEHVLRDERLRGRITASKVVGRRIRYSKQDLLDYLAGRRIDQ